MRLWTGKRKSTIIQIGKKTFYYRIWLTVGTICFELCWTYSKLNVNSILSRTDIIVSFMIQYYSINCSSSISTWDLIWMCVVCCWQLLSVHMIWLKFIGMNFACYLLKILFKCWTAEIQRKNDAKERVKKKKNVTLVDWFLSMHGLNECHAPLNLLLTKSFDQSKI